jgi:YggT family protein
MGVRGLLIDLLELYEIIVVLSVVLSWFPVSNPGGTMDQLRMVLARLTEPVLGPIRRLIPAIGGGGVRLDLSPLIVILVIQLLLIPIIAR